MLSALSSPPNTLEDHHKAAAVRRSRARQMGHRNARNRAQMLSVLWPGLQALHVLLVVLLLVCNNYAASDAAAETCAFIVSPGDVGVGIAVVTDPVCKTSGGVGCFADSVCRYCKTKSTTQSQHLLDCAAIVKAAPVSTPAPVAAISAPAPAPTSPDRPIGGASSLPACAQVVSTGNAAAGIDIVTDTSCANGGLGCIDSICRLCKNQSTAQSGHYLSCKSINSAYDSVITPAPAPSPAPKPATSAPPISITAPPATSTPSSPSSSTVASSLTSETCSFVVSPGDASVGIVVLTDASCKTQGGGVGCFGPTSVCRYCKSKSTPQSDHLRACDSFTPPPSTSANPVVVVATPTPTTASPSTHPSVPATVSSGGTTVQTPPADFCSDALITSSQATAGIWAVFDPSCPRDGDLGDCNEYCRMCQFIDTSAPTKLRSCSGVLATVAAVAADSGVWSPSDLVLPDTPPASQCTATLAPATVNAGIWMTFTCLTVDPSSTSDTRCLQAKCDCCKYFETPASSEYPPCDAPVFIVDSEASVQVAVQASRELRVVPSSDNDDGEDSKLTSANAEGSAAIGALVILVAVMLAVSVARTVRNFHRSCDAKELP